jgi:uncharacterized protein YidB (DUF937 family)
MGLLDQLLGGTGADAVRDDGAGVSAPVLGALLPVVLGMLADRRGPGAAAVVPAAAAHAPALSDALGSVGGLAGLLARFSHHGHGPLASSWVCNGANEPLAPQVVGEVFSAAELGAIAARAGVAEEEARRGLAVLLPAVVDYFTPAGELPARDRLLTALTDYEKRLPH